MLPEGYDYKQYLPTEEDFAKVLEYKRNGRSWDLFSFDWDPPYYYAAIRRYLACILLKCEEGGKTIAQKALGGRWEYINGVKTLVPYYSKEDLAELRALAVEHKSWFYDAFKKYAPAAYELESPEKRVQKLKDERKGQVEVKSGGTGAYRIIPYSMKYGWDPNKKASGAKMHLFFGEKVGDKYKIVVRGSNLYGSGKDAIKDAPYFLTDQEAKDFVNNVDHNHINTQVTLEDWRFVISNKPMQGNWIEVGRRVIDGVDYGPKYGHEKLNIMPEDLVKVDTICGPAYMHKDCKYLKETLENTTMKYVLDEDTVKQGNKWVNKGSEGTHGEFKTKKAADAQRKAMFANGFHEEYSIAEDIEKHDTLNSVLFEGNKLKPEVREKLIKIANTFIEGLAEDGIKFNLKDIVFIGSNASYNYTKDSDIDLHLVADVDSLECPDNLYPLLYGAYRALFNKKFDIDFYGIKVELYVEPEGAPTVSNGIYSVLNDAWIKEPTQVDIPEINMEEFNKDFQPWEDKYNALIAKINAANTTDEYKTLGDEIERLITDIYEQRRMGITISEYSNQNLLFKEFRNRGYLDNLKQLKCDLKAKELSLPEKKTDDFIDEEWLGEYLNDDQRYEVSQDLTQAADGNKSMVWPDDRFEIDNIPTNRAEPINKKIHGLNYVEDALVDGEPGWTAKKEKYPHRSHIIVGKIDPHKVD